MRNDTLVGDAVDVRTERLANQDKPSPPLVSQTQQAQVERTEVTQLITSNVTGTANQITATPSGSGVVLSLPSTITVATSYQVAGTKVVGARETGWTAGTGTANKGAFATYAGQTVSAAYVQAEAQATDNGVKANAQRIKAIEDALRTHGLII
jgi:hypothetical protein